MNDLVSHNVISSTVSHNEMLISRNEVNQKFWFIVTI